MSRLLTNQIVRETGERNYVIDALLCLCWKKHVLWSETWRLLAKNCALSHAQFFRTEGYDDSNGRSVENANVNLDFTFMVDRCASGVQQEWDPGSTVFGEVLIEGRQARYVKEDVKEDAAVAEEDSELEDAGTDVDDDDGRKKPTVTNRLWFFAILIGGMAKKVSKQT